MSAPSHDRLIQRLSFRAALVADSAIHVGTGQPGAEDATDMPVARDGRGAPYIPGSSFRGAFRSSLESLLRGLDRPDVRVCDPFERTEGKPDVSCAERVRKAREELRDITESQAFDLAWKESCEICRLFGHLFLASRVRVADLGLLSDPDETPTYVRDGVGLDRDLRTAAGGILYTFEAVAAGARFNLRLEVENAGPHEVGLLLTGLDLFGEGFARLGGKSARGLGLARVTDLSLVRRSAEDFFRGSAGAVLTTDELGLFRSAARQYYLREDG